MRIREAKASTERKFASFGAIIFRHGCSSHFHGKSPLESSSVLTAKQSKWEDKVSCAKIQNYSRRAPKLTRAALLRSQNKLSPWMYLNYHTFQIFHTCPEKEQWLGIGHWEFLLSKKLMFRKYAENTRDLEGNTKKWWVKAKIAMCICYAISLRQHKSPRPGTFDMKRNVIKKISYLS